MTETATRQLDDVMMAMDIVDTLRHRALIVEKELGTDAREADMLRRLKEIYSGQGIEVPDHILRDGVKALEENRFVYSPPGDSFSLRLAKFYVSRDRWLRPLLIIVGLAVAGVLIYRFAIVEPARQAFNSAQSTIEKAYTNAAELVQSTSAKARLDALYAGAKSAIASKNKKQMQSSAASIRQIEEVLSKPLSIRIISRPGEMSGVFRIPDDVPNARNYYLIVEAVDAAGQPVSMEITSEEDQRTAYVTKWGVRVPEHVFDAVKADKQDDQIIQNAKIGDKAVGYLLPTYTIETGDGTILDW